MTEIQILNLLNIRPMYGVEMIEEIKRLSGNAVIMSLPTLYSALHKMATRKLVNSYWQEAEIGGRRHVYNITKTGREYREKNPIEIDYELLKTQVKEDHKTYSTLEEAFSLPLNNHPSLNEVAEDKRVLKLNREPEPTLANKTKISPYLLPTDKVSATDEVKHKQMTINLTGTLGSPNLRPLLKLNQVPVGNDFVAINLLRIVASLVTIALFVLFNALFSLAKTAKVEYYNLVYICLLTYFAVVLAIYLVFPKAKAMFLRGKSFRWRAVATICLMVVIGIVCGVNHSLGLIWLGLFAFVPVVECLLMIALRKGKVFRC